MIHVLLIAIYLIVIAASLVVWEWGYNELASIMLVSLAIVTAMVLVIINREER